MTRNLNISQMATAVMLWLSYKSAVGRNYVLSESALRFPVSEYLGQSDVEEIELEFGHPKLFKKRFDLFFKDNLKDNNVFEFKYIKKGSTRTDDEKQRVFDDLMRLNLYLSANQKGYFLICGDQFQFISSFQTLLLKPTTSDGTFIQSRFRSSAPKTVSPNGFYTEWFSFDSDNPEKIIDIKNATGEYKKIYECFQTDYSDSYKKKGNGKLLLPDSVKTKLVFLSEDFKNQQGLFQPAKIGIWEIIRTL